MALNSHFWRRTSRSTAAAGRVSALRNKLITSYKSRGRARIGKRPDLFAERLFVGIGLDGDTFVRGIAVGMEDL